MSAETDFRAVLAAWAPLTALVGTRIAQNAVDAGVALPYVVFSAQHDPALALLDGVPLAQRVSLGVQCWGATAAEADAVADQVVAALQAGAPPARGAALLGRAAGYDGELQLDATVLTIEWWA